MTGAFLIEAAGDTAGVALPARGGFRFVATATAFSTLDGTVFRSAATAQRAAERLARGRTREPTTSSTAEARPPLGWGLLVPARRGAQAGLAA